MTQKEYVIWRPPKALITLKHPLNYKTSKVHWVISVLKQPFQTQDNQPVQTPKAPA